VSLGHARFHHGDATIVVTLARNEGRDTEAPTSIWEEIAHAVHDCVAALQMALHRAYDTGVSRCGRGKSCTGKSSGSAKKLSHFRSLFSLDRRRSDLRRRKRAVEARRFGRICI
jgi:hypothetical protein